MPKKKLTATNVEALTALGGARTEWRDTVLPGFVLRVTPSGERSYAVEYSWRGESRRETLGSLEHWKLAAAREEARRLRAKVDLGVDPRAERLVRAAEEAAKVKGATTVTALTEAWLASPEAAKWRPNTRKEFERMVRVEVRPELGDSPAAGVTRGHVRGLVEKIAARPAGYQANRTLGLLKQLWAWALDRELVVSSPVAGIKKPHEEKPRDIEWSNAEIRQIFAALPAGGPDLADTIALLFYTGARASEVAGMAWAEVDLERREWALPPERSKVGRKKPRTRVIPLVAPALEILRRRRDVKVVALAGSGLVFPAARGGGYVARSSVRLLAIKRASGVADFKPHGIRHTIKGRFARLGVAPHIAEAVLGHAIPGMAGQYTGTRVLLLDEQRAALELWAGELGRILSEQKSAAVASRA
jgi:integrase